MATRSISTLRPRFGVSVSFFALRQRLYLYLYLYPKLLAIEFGFRNLSNAGKLNAPSAHNSEDECVIAWGPV